MIWTCTEDVQLRLELPGRMPRGRPKRRFDRCSERGHEVSRCDRGGGTGQGEMETDDLLWQPLKRTAERKR